MSSWTKTLHIQVENYAVGIRLSDLRRIVEETKGWPDDLQVMEGRREINELAVGE
jgi:hypothetical protein